MKISEIVVGGLYENPYGTDKRCVMEVESRPTTGEVVRIRYVSHDNGILRDYDVTPEQFGPLARWCLRNRRAETGDTKGGANGSFSQVR